MSGEGILVTCTRFQRWRDLFLLAPLYTAGDHADRLRVIKRFQEALKRKPEAEADMARVEELCQQTQALHWQRLHEAHGINPLPPTPPEQPLDLSRKAPKHPQQRKRGRR